MRKELRVSRFLLGMLGAGLLAATEAQASHYIGSDLAFSATGTPGFYNLKLRVYRDCGGITFGQNITLLGTSSCGTTSAMLSQVSVTDAKGAVVCQGQTTECTGNPAIPGVEQVVYEGTVQLSACANWKFTFTGNARNDGILNLNNGNTDALDWWTDAMINTSGTLNNNSPVFWAPPVPNVCVQDTVNYNPQVTDQDGDSLVFSLVAARTSPNGVAIPYTSGYSAAQPFGTPAAATPNNFAATMNAQTGQFTFLPMQVGTYVVVLRVDEYRQVNGQTVHVGFVHRDVQFEAVSCTTPPPVLGLLRLLENNTVIDSFTFNQIPVLNTCVPYCIEIPAASVGAGVNLSILSNTSNEIPNSTFTVLNQNTPNPVGQLCFIPDPSLAGQIFHYTIAVSDDVCPFPNDFIRALQVQVVPYAPEIVSVTAPITTLLQGQTTTISTVVQPNPSSVTYSWSPVAGLSDPTVPDPVVSYSGAPSVTYTLTVSSGACTDSETITFNFAPNAAPIGGFTYTLNGCCQLSITSTAVGASTTTYNFGDGSAIVTEPNPTHLYTAAGTYTITQTVTNALGTDTALRVISVLSSPEAMALQQVNLFPNPTAGLVQLDLSSLSDAEPILVQVFDLLGREIFRQAVTGGSVASLALQLAPAGAYQLRLKAREGVLTKQLLLQR